MTVAAPLSPTLPPGDEEQWEELSPDGLTRVRWQITHGRMSHMMITPALHDAATDAPFLRLDSGYDGQIEWLGEGRLRLVLRHYDRAGGASVIIDRGAGTFVLETEGEPGAAEPLARLAERIEGRFAGPRWQAPPTLTEGHRRADRFRLAMLLLGAVAAGLWFVASG